MPPSRSSSSFSVNNPHRSINSSNSSRLSSPFSYPSKSPSLSSIHTSKSSKSKPSKFLFCSTLVKLFRVSIILSLSLYIVYSYLKTPTADKVAFDAVLSTFPQMLNNSDWPPEMVQPNKQFKQDPSLYDSPLYADYHIPIQYESSTALQQAIADTYVVPSDLKHVLGGERVISLYNTRLNSQLGENNVLHSPLDFWFQRCQHPNSLFNLIKTRRLILLELRRGSVYFKLFNNGTDPVPFFLPRGTVIDAPENQQPMYLTQNWEGIVPPGGFAEMHMPWLCMCSNCDSPTYDFRLTPFFVSAYADSVPSQEELWNYIQPGHSSSKISPSNFIGDYFGKPTSTPDDDCKRRIFSGPVDLSGEYVRNTPPLKHSPPSSADSDSPSFLSRVKDALSHLVTSDTSKKAVKQTAYTLAAYEIAKRATFAAVTTAGGSSASTSSFVTAAASSIGKTTSSIISTLPAPIPAVIVTAAAVGTAYEAYKHRDEIINKLQSFRESFKSRFSSSTTSTADADTGSNSIPSPSIPSSHITGIDTPHLTPAHIEIDLSASEFNKAGAQAAIRNLQRAVASGNAFVTEQPLAAHSMSEYHEDFLAHVASHTKPSRSAFTPVNSLASTSIRTIGTAAASASLFSASTASPLSAFSASTASIGASVNPLAHSSFHPLDRFRSAADSILTHIPGFSAAASIVAARTNIALQKYAVGTPIADFTVHVKELSSVGSATLARADSSTDTQEATDADTDDDNESDDDSRCKSDEDFLRLSPAERQALQNEFIRKQVSSGVWVRERSKSPSQQLWKHKLKNIFYTRDRLHKDIEVWKGSGKRKTHVGSINPCTGEIYKPPKHAPQELE